MSILHAEPPWLEAARLDLGLTEIHGAVTAPKISQWLMDLGAWWSDDETPWCGVACAHWMRTSSIEVPKAFYRAKAWESWGLALTRPALGCVVTFTREGGGHVGLVAGVADDGRLIVIGGNQGDSVKFSLFDRSRVTSYRWPAPTMYLWSGYDTLPLLTAQGLPLSHNEA